MATAALLASVVRPGESIRGAFARLDIGGHDGAPARATHVRLQLRRGLPRSGARVAVFGAPRDGFGRQAGPRWQSSSARASHTRVRSGSSTLPTQTTTRWVCLNRSKCASPLPGSPRPSRRMTRAFAGDPPSGVCFAGAREPRGDNQDPSHTNLVLLLLSEKNAASVPLSAVPTGITVAMKMSCQTSTMLHHAACPCCRSWR